MVLEGSQGGEGRVVNHSSGSASTEECPIYFYRVQNYITFINMYPLRFDFMEEKNRVCPVERAGSLEGRLRRLAHNPKRILRNYVKVGMTVLDLGCGPGFFSVEMARMVGDSGLVIAADLQKGMLDKLRDKIKGTALERRVHIHKCEEDSIGVSKKIDLLLAFYVFHELPDQERTLKEIKSILKPGGILYMIEPNFHVKKKAFEKSVIMAVDAGFEVIERPRVFLSRTAVFRKQI